MIDISKYKINCIIIKITPYDIMIDISKYKINCINNWKNSIRYHEKYKQKQNKLHFSHRKIQTKCSPNLGTPDWKKVHPLSERLASLGMMGAQLKAPLKPLSMIVVWRYEEFQEGPQLGPPWCRKMSVSRIAVRLIVVVFPVWSELIIANGKKLKCAQIIII